MRRALFVLGVVLLIVLSAGVIWLNLPRDQGRVIGRTVTDKQVVVELISPEYSLDRVYMSMQGPRSNQPKIKLLDSAPPDEVVWLTGVRTDVVDPQGARPVSNEFFCHSNLTFHPGSATPESHNATFQSHLDWRLFTLIPGRMEVKLPEGFGIPVRNDTEFDYLTMALNQNPGKFLDIRMKTQIYCQRQDEKRPLRPLFRRSVYVYQQHQEQPGEMHGSLAAQAHAGEFCAESCEVDKKGATPSLFKWADGLEDHPGATCCVKNASEDGVVDQFGSHNTIHWMVPPGDHQYRTEVTQQMLLPFDTTVHYVTGHLHPFGTRLRLIDMETQETLIEITGKSFEDKLGVAHMSEIISQQGLPLEVGRRYELIADYSNPQDHPIDAMAILYLYAADEAPARIAQAQ